jgi:hypothetical protein
MIESYSFGDIVIDGTTYTSDVIIYPDKINSDWIRRKGHLLQKEDLTDLSNYQLDVLIVGTGYFGRMKVSNDTKQFLQDNEINLIAKKTKKACDMYNDLKEKQKVAAALHLTC